VVKVVLQGFQAETRAWPYVQIDIWRVNFGDSVQNVAKQVAAGQVIDPCNDLNQVSGAEPVALGSENVDVGRNQPFAITYSNNVLFQDNCVCK
jgi:hypothetical protein